jgi:hypothetical protein
MAEGNARGDGLGVPATDRNRQTSRMTLMLAAKALHYSENCMTYPGLGAKPLDQLKHEFEKQLLCWEKIVDYDETDPQAKVRFKWTAKYGNCQNDDLAVAGLQLVYWPEVLYANPVYTQWLAEHVTPRGVMPNSQQSVQPGQAHVPERPVARPAGERGPQLQAILESSNRHFQQPMYDGGGLRKRLEIGDAPHVDPDGGPAPKRKRLHPALRQQQQPP